MDRWLERFGATPFDYNRGLDDDSLSAENPPEFHRLEGSNFFRGLALIDLAEAMLKRAFGRDAVAVRVNAAGQGDYFQVHVDTHAGQPERREAVPARGVLPPLRPGAGPGVRRAPSRRRRRRRAAEPLRRSPATGPRAPNSGTGYETP